MAANQFGDDPLGEEVEDLWIAEETGDVDQQVLGKEIEFIRVGVQQSDVAIDILGLDRRHRHAPLDPALQRAGLV